MNFMDILKNVVPMVLSLHPKTAPYVNIVTGAVQIAEASKLPGKDKRDLAKQIASVSAKAANTISASLGDGPVVNEFDAVNVTDKSVDTIIEVANMVRDIHANTEHNEKLNNQNK